MQSKLTDILQRKEARHRAILEILPTSKEKAFTKAELYEQLTLKNSDFKAKQKNGSDPRNRFKTILRELYDLCEQGKVARYKSTGESGKNDMFTDAWLDQIDKETWIEITRRTISNDEPEHKKIATIELKQLILGIAKKELSKKSQQEKQLGKPFSRYKANWKGDWRYFRFSDENTQPFSNIFFGRQVQLTSSGSTFTQKNERFLSDNLLQKRLLNYPGLNLLPDTLAKEKINLIFDALRHKKKLSFSFVKSNETKEEELTAEPIGLWDDHGIYKLITYQQIDRSIKIYHLNFMEDLYVSGQQLHRLSEQEIYHLLISCSQGERLTEEVEQIILQLHGNVALKFHGKQLIGATNTTFSWVDKSKYIAQVSFDCQICEKLVEQILSLGAHVNVIGSNALKKCLQHFTEQPIKHFEEMTFTESFWAK